MAVNERSQLPGRAGPGFGSAPSSRLRSRPRSWLANAYGVLKALAKKSGEISFEAPNGGLAVYSTSRPTNVYLAYPGSNVQIEVYDPSAEQARSLISSGQVSPVTS
jgi:hypothetical protein